MKRKLKFLWQRITRGWDDSETWNLDYQFCLWLAPRLRRYKELSDGIPSSFVSAHEEKSFNEVEEMWDETLSEIIWAAEFYIEKAFDVDYESHEWDRFHKAMQLYYKYWMYLWW